MTEVMTEAPPVQGTPMGGSELILANLKAALPELTEQVQIIVSRPELVTLDETKPKVLWLQDLPTDPASRRLSEPGYRTNFNRIVCVSNWQQQQYNAHLRIPFNDLTVIKNAVPRLFEPQLPKTSIPFRFIYTSTPHRGLSLLAAAAEILASQRQDWELRVYSSLNIYGWHEQDKQFQPLYDQLMAVPQVKYFGSRPNEEVREAVCYAHAFVYPSIYMETSCMAIQEALMAGCAAITSNIGALPETCGEWAYMFSANEDAHKMVGSTVEHMNWILDHYRDAEVQDRLARQMEYYREFYAFEERIPQWKALLEAVIAEGPKEEMLVIG